MDINIFKKMGSVRDKYLVDNGRENMNEEKRALVRDNIKHIFEVEGIAWNRETFKGYITGLNFSMINDCAGEEGDRDSIMNATITSKTRQRAFINICVAYAILDDWNKEVEKRMSSVPV